jgi:leader peptidase (prepilin peptidase)/N-methyltransferase
MTEWEWPFLAIFFLLGLTLGSFFNVVIYRCPRQLNVAKGRSFCPDCRHRLGCWDLVPLFSFLCLGGRCRYCRAKISWRYPLVEFLTGAGLALLFFFFGLSLPFFQWAILYLLLIPLFFIDLEHQLLPDSITLPGIVIGLAFQIVQGFWWQSLLGMAIGGVLFGLIYFLWKGGMGAGDIKLALMLGAFLVYPLVIPWFLLSFLIGAVGGIMGMVVFGLKGKSAIPFGPYMALAALMVAFWGQPMVSWYLQLIGF